MADAPTYDQLLALGNGLCARKVSARRRSGRRTWQQPGSGAAALWLVDEPDEIIDHVPTGCGGGADLAGATPAGRVRPQVHDNPLVTARVTEHRLRRRRCDCGQVSTAAAAVGVSAAAVYGPNLPAPRVYLLVYQHIPVARAAELIADLTGAAPSTGWMCGVLTRTAETNRLRGRDEQMLRFARKHGINTLAALRDTIIGHPGCHPFQPGSRTVVA